MREKRELCRCCHNTLRRGSQQREIPLFVLQSPGEHHRATQHGVGSYRQIVEMPAFEKALVHLLVTKSQFNLGAGREPVRTPHLQTASRASNPTSNPSSIILIYRPAT